MEKIIIRVYDGIPVTEAILMVHRVIHEGRTSNNGKSYCYITAFNGGDIAVDALQERAEKAEAMVERMIGCVDKAKGAVRSYFTLFRAPHVGSFLDDWNALVAEWKERE